MRRAASVGACAPAPHVGRACAALLLGLACAALQAQAQPALAGQRGQGAPALREMQIHKVAALGLEIWVENQPPWQARLATEGGHPTFVAESPDSYHPPTVMTYASWPKERVHPDLVRTMAATAIRRASRNFGLTEAESRALAPTPATYGTLPGFEASFPGRSGDTPVDVTVFVGQAPGRFPVALSMYTLSGKMAHLKEQRRRAWTRLKYLPAP